MKRSLLGSWVLSKALEEIATLIFAQYCFFAVAVGSLERELERDKTLPLQHFSNHHLGLRLSQSKLCPSHRSTSTHHIHACLIFVFFGVFGVFFTDKTGLKIFIFIFAMIFVLITCVKNTPLWGKTLLKSEKIFSKYLSSFFGCCRRPNISDISDL